MLNGDAYWALSMPHRSADVVKSEKKKKPAAKSPAKAQTGVKVGKKGTKAKAVKDPASIKALAAAKKVRANAVCLPPSFPLMV